MMMSTSTVRYPPPAAATPAAPSYGAQATSSPALPPPSSSAFRLLHNMRGKDLVSIFKKKCESCRIRPSKRIIRRLEAIDEGRTRVLDLSGIPCRSDGGGDGPRRRRDVSKQQQQQRQRRENEAHDDEEEYALLPSPSSSTSLPVPSFSVALECIPLAHGVTEVNCARTNVSDEDVEQLCHFLSMSPSVTALDVSQNASLHRACVKSLADLLRHKNNLIELRCVECPNLRSEEVRLLEELAAKNVASLMMVKRRMSSSSQQQQHTGVVAGLNYSSSTPPPSPAPAVIHSHSFRSREDSAAATPPVTPLMLMMPTKDDDTNKNNNNNDCVTEGPTSHAADLVDRIFVAPLHAVLSWLTWEQPTTSVAVLVIVFVLLFTSLSTVLSTVSLLYFFGKRPKRHNSHIRPMATVAAAPLLLSPSLAATIEQEEKSHGESVQVTRTLEWLWSPYRNTNTGASSTHRDPSGFVTDHPLSHARDRLARLHRQLGSGLYREQSEALEEVAQCVTQMRHTLTDLSSLFWWFRGDRRNVFGGMVALVAAGGVGGLLLLLLSSSSISPSTVLMGILLMLFGLDAAWLPIASLLLSVGGGRRGGDYHTSSIDGSAATAPTTTTATNLLPPPPPLTPPPAAEEEDSVLAAIERSVQPQALDRKYSRVMSRHGSQSGTSAVGSPSGRVPSSTTTAVQQQQPPPGTTTDSMLDTYRQQLNSVLSAARGGGNSRDVTMEANIVPPSRSASNLVRRSQQAAAATSGSGLDNNNRTSFSSFTGHSPMTIDREDNYPSPTTTSSSNDLHAPPPWWSTAGGRGASVGTTSSPVSFRRVVYEMSSSPYAGTSGDHNNHDSSNATPRTSDEPFTVLSRGSGSISRNLEGKHR